jgi:alanine dehydrogenase
MPKLADVLGGRAPGRASPQQTTWYLNSGLLGAGFEALAAAAYERARELGIGTEIPTDWFLQDIRD